jgi:GTP-binding protein Era
MSDQPSTPETTQSTGHAFRAGFVTLIGKPNVGKSTLLNHIVGQKVSIVSNKPQTTRRRVIGITTTDTYQIAFIDTPGIHEPHTQLGRAMVDQARSALNDMSVVVYVADGSHHPGEGDKQIAQLVKASLSRPEGIEARAPLLLCLNKMDLLKAEDVQRNVDAYCGIFGTEEYMLTTATRGQNVDRLVQMIVDKLPEADPMYDPDEFTDQSSRFLSAELVREKILIATRQEVPHSTAVLVDDWEEEDGLIRISATILVEKASQRGILIGKQGQFLKNIGTQARGEIEGFLGKKVFLELHVKVAEGWRMSPRILHELEYSE